MHAITPNTIVILTTLSAVSSLAQSSELTLATALAETPDPGAQPIPTLIYRNGVTDTMAVGEVSVRQISAFWEAEKALWNATSIRNNVLSMKIPLTGVVMSNDRASFAVYAPMQSVNGALSLAGYVTQSRLNDSLVNMAQVLSFAARRQINAEFAYSMRADRYSRFDSAITYRLNPSSGSDRSDVVVSLRYSVKF